MNSPNPPCHLKKPTPHAPYKPDPRATADGQIIDSDSKETDGYKLGLKPPEHVEIFFDTRDSSYWFKLNGRYFQYKKADLAMHLRAMGLKEKIYFNGQREIDWPLWRAMTHRAVDYAGPLAGHKTGVFKDGSGRQYLVTDEACGVFAEKQMVLGENNQPKFLIEFFNELLPDGQVEFFFNWLAVGLRSLQAGDFVPGQFIVFAGEGGCGKSLAQYIITEIFGGRPGSPFAYMSGETNFNRDFFGAEHWLIEDPRGSKAMADRIFFGARLKEATVNRYYTIHAKNKDAIYLPLFRRGTISVNLELEYLSVLPPMDLSIQDKIMLFKCAKVVSAFDPIRDKKTKMATRDKIEAQFLQEAPAFRAWLLKTYPARSIPADLRDERFVIAAYHHPEIKDALSSLSHEQRLIELLDDLYFSDDEDAPLPVTKQQAAIQKDLLEKNRFEAEKILRYPGACGSLLGKLAKSTPDRVSMRRIHGYAHWTVNPPLVTKDN